MGHNKSQACRGARPLALQLTTYPSGTHKFENHRPLAGKPVICEPWAAEAALPAQAPLAQCTERAWMGPLEGCLQWPAVVC